LTASSFSTPHYKTATALRIDSMLEDKTPTRLVASSAWRYLDEVTNLVKVDGVALLIYGCSMDDGAGI
jgi:hypothetical protein